MKTASALIQSFALAACFAAHSAFADELDGVRRALQTMACAQAEIVTLPDPAGLRDR